MDQKNVVSSVALELLLPLRCHLLQPTQQTQKIGFNNKARADTTRDKLFFQ